VSRTGEVEELQPPALGRRVALILCLALTLVVSSAQRRAHTPHARARPSHHQTQLGQRQRGGSGRGGGGRRGV
jgi:hypothetical protein